MCALAVAAAVLLLPLLAAAEGGLNRCLDVSWQGGCGVGVRG